MYLYHYCSEEKLINILKSKKLWLTPIDCMNDREEMVHLYFNIWDKAEELLYRNCNHKLLEDILNLVNHHVKNIMPYSYKPYCACFSDEGDLLSQWREYADGAQGVSIGFESEWFKILKKLPHPNKYIKEAVGIGKVIYDYEKQLEIIYKISKYLMENEVKDISGYLYIMKNIKVYSAVFKNHSFYTERERRIIYYGDDDHVHNDDFISGPHNYVNDRKRYEISWFKQYDNHAIAKVYIGPKSKYTKEDIKNLFSSNNILIDEKDIKNSSSTYV